MAFRVINGEGPCVNDPEKFSGVGEETIGTGSPDPDAPKISTSPALRLVKIPLPQVASGEPLSINSPAARLQGPSPLSEEISFRSGWWNHSKDVDQWIASASALIGPDKVLSSLARFAMTRSARKTSTGF